MRTPLVGDRWRLPASSFLLLSLIVAWPAAASCLDRGETCVDVCDYDTYHNYPGYFWDPIAMRGTDPFWSFTDESTDVVLRGHGFEAGAAITLDIGRPKPMVGFPGTSLFHGASFSDGRGVVAGTNVSCHGGGPHGGSCHCNYSSELTFWDLSDPTDAGPVASLPHPGWPQVVALSGPLAFIGVDQTLEIFDMAAAGGPAIVGELETGHGIVDIATDGAHVYIGTEHAGVLIVSAASPDQPEIVAEVGLAEPVVRVAYSDGHLYAGTRADYPDTGRYLVVIDLDSPGGPSVTGQLPLTVDDLEVREDHVYVAGGSTGFHVVRIDPSGRPLLLKTIETGSSATGIDLGADLAFLSIAWPGSIQIYDLGNPELPFLTGTLPGRYWSRDVVVSGDLALLISTGTTHVSDGCDEDYSWLQLYDVGSPRTPTAVGSVGAWSSPSGEIGQLVRAGEYLFSANQAGDFLSFDLTDPGNPALIGAADIPFGQVVSLATSGDRVFVSWGRQVSVVDVTDPTQPEFADLFDTGLIVGGIRKLVASGGRLYAAGRDAIVIYDVQETDPTLLGRFEAGGTDLEIAAHGNLVYMLQKIGFRSDLVVLDLATPESPQLLGELEVDTWGPGRIGMLDAEHVVHANSRLLTVVDVRRPDAPVAVGSHAIDGASRGLALGADTAFVANSLGVAAVGVADRSDPRPAGRVWRNNDNVDFAIASGGDHLLVADKLLHVVRSNPPVLSEVGSIETATFTVPEGFSAGAYDVRVTNRSCPRVGLLPNGFRICEHHELTATFHPAGPGEASDQWTLVLGGDEAFFGSPPDREALLLLPDLPARVAHRYLPGHESVAVTIEIRVTSDGEVAQVLLSGATESEAVRVWQRAKELGGLTLPRRGDRAYGPVRLEPKPRPRPLGSSLPDRPGWPASEPAPGSVVYRYELVDDLLRAATRFGAEAELVFEVTGRDENLCETRVTVGG